MTRHSTRVGSYANISFSLPLVVRPVLPKPLFAAGDGRSQDTSWLQLTHPMVGVIPTPRGVWRKSDILMVATGHQDCEAGCKGDNRRPRRSRRPEQAAHGQETNACPNCRQQRQTLTRGNGSGPEWGVDRRDERVTWCSSIHPYGGPADSTDLQAASNGESERCNLARDSRRVVARREGDQAVCLRGEGLPEKRKAWGNAHDRLTRARSRGWKRCR